MLNFILITNCPETASLAVRAGVGRIFIDLERNGKADRQGGMNTFISDHQLSDIPVVRKAIPNAELMVRINPIHAGTPVEVEQVLAAGPDILMLPMFTHPSEVQYLLDCVQGRARVIPLIETASAFTRLDQLVELTGLSEVYIGLNDLHLSLGLDFLFEPLAAGLIDHGIGIIRKAGLSYGFGGMGLMHTQPIPGSLILSEHVRLGSSSVILSRAFKAGLSKEDPAGFAQAIQGIRTEEARLHHLDEEALAANHDLLKVRVRETALQLRHAKSASTSSTPHAPASNVSPARNNPR